MRRFVIVVAVCLTLVAVVPRTVGARQGTPGAALDVPGAAECKVQPRSLGDLLGLATGGSGSVQDVLTAVTPTSAERLPKGKPADATTTAAVTATARELVACVNARDAFRALALLSDDYLGKLASAVMSGGSAGINMDQIYSALPIGTATGVDPSQPIPALVVRDVRLLPGGKVGAIVAPPVSLASAVPGLVTFVIFVRPGDRWLIDSAVVIREAATPAA